MVFAICSHVIVLKLVRTLTLSEARLFRLFLPFGWLICRGSSRMRGKRCDIYGILRNWGTLPM